MIKKEIIKLEIEKEQEWSGNNLDREDIDELEERLSMVLQEEKSSNLTPNK